MRSSSSKWLFVLLLCGACSNGTADTPTDASTPTDGGAIDAPNSSAQDAQQALDAKPSDDAASADAFVAADGTIVDANAFDAARDGAAPDADTDGGSSAACAFGNSLDEAMRKQELTIVEHVTLDEHSTLTGVQENQIVAALHESAHTDVMTASEAFDAADGNIIEYYRGIESTTRGVFEIYVYGAGDNTYGAFFLDGVNTRLASVHDGDIYDCSLRAGVYASQCSTSGDCQTDEVCQGIVESKGRCVPSDSPLGTGNVCMQDSDCLVEFGLVCAGASRGVGTGFCGPSWMRSRWGAAMDVELSSGSGTRELGIGVNGLASADADVWLAIGADTTDLSELTIVVRNPSGTEGTPNFSAAADEGYFMLYPVTGFSGDEGVNGTWRVEFAYTGSTPIRLRYVELRIGSRWD